MSIPLPLSNNTISTFLYEPFSYTISFPTLNPHLTTTSNTPGIPPGYLTNNGSNVVFATSSNVMNIGTEVFSITAILPGNTSENATTVSNTVTISPGRFLNGSGNSYVGSNFTFFSRQPITPIRLVAPFAISTPTSVPALPPGLTYTPVSSNIFDITGTPSVTVPQSNYLFIGRGIGANLGKIVSSQFALSISNERVLLNLSGSPIVSPMTVDTPITQRVVTAAFPPYPSGGILRYSWSGLPDGIIITDLSGITQPGFFTPVDPSYSLILKGTPTLAAANAFRNAGITSNVVAVNAVRTSPLPQISNSVGFAFAFGETVLFDTTVVPTLYNGVALDPSAIFYRAQTYFGTGSPISNIFSPNLRSDLSLNFVPAEARAYLTGTPSNSLGTNTFTITAINSNGITRDLSSTITVANDVVTFTSVPIDVCFNFVISRPAVLALSGYYPSNIRFQAVAASGNPVVFNAPGLVGTGLSLSNVTSNTVQIVGIPDTITALKNVSIVASAVGTPATASRDISLAVLNDVFTLVSPTGNLSFIQNRAITPVQFTVTTLSERPVSSFTSPNLPAGLSLSTTGLLTGTPAIPTLGTNTFTLNTSTGYTSQNNNVSYNILQDNAIIALPSNIPTPLVFSNVSFDILTYSGAEGDLSGILSQPLPKQSTSATASIVSNRTLSGDFSVVPVLAPEYRFEIQGRVGSFLPFTLVKAQVSNPPTLIHTVLTRNVTNAVIPVPLDPSGTPASLVMKIFTSTDTPVEFDAEFGLNYQPTGPKSWIQRYSNSSLGLGCDMAQNSNVVVAVFGSNMIRSTDYGVTWSNIPSSNIQTIPGLFGPLWLQSNPTYGFRRYDNPLFGAITNDGTSNWYAIGGATIGTSTNPPSISIVRTSTDNGVTWSDISTNAFLEVQQSNKLSYNNGRLFATTGGLVSAASGLTVNRLYYADISDLKTWSSPTGSVTFASDSVTGIAFSNSDVFAVGTSNVSPLEPATFYSSNNGQSFVYAANPNSNALGDSNSYGDVFRRDQYWMICGDTNGDTYASWSSNLTTWSSNLLSNGIGKFTAVTENGISWLFGLDATDINTTTNWGAVAWPLDSGSISNIITPSLPSSGSVKRILSSSFSNTTPSLILSTPLDASGIVFVDPPQSTYTFWQFVSNSIPVFASNPAPGSFMYYYSTGLPRGLRLELDTSGIDADILGQSSQYNDSFQRVTLYAANGSGIASKNLSVRTILPTVTRQQTGAGSWTSLVRQYTVVNAAQNSVNGRALPSTEPPLGEFTRPEPPDSISAESNPNCERC